MTHALGWQRDLPDHRDHLYNLTAPIRQATALPDIGGLDTSEIAPVWNQLTIGSCTAHGSLGVYLTEAIKQGLALPQLSRLMQYFDTRSLEGTTGQDAGGRVRDAIKALATFGCAPEVEWPYDVAKFTVRPPASCYRDAHKHMAIRYQRIVTGPGAPIRTALHAKQAIVFGFPVPVSFEDGTWDPASGQPLPLPGPGEGFIGGHCIYAYRYDFSQPFVSGPFGSYRTPPYFTCRNSWDTGWGMGGDFNLAADWFAPLLGLASDLWILQAVT